MGKAGNAYHFAAQMTMNMQMLFSRIVNKLKNMSRSFLMLFGVDYYLQTDDRRVLESIIFPYFVSHTSFTKILFVGCSWYTKPYNNIFKNKEYQTLELNPVKRRFGSRKHITDSIENLNLYFHEGELDLIVCNGLIGFGLNDKSSAEKSFHACFTCLRRGGVLIIGWNDIPDKRPFVLDDLESLKLFQPLVFPPLEAAQFLTSTSIRHTFNFFVK